MRIFFKKLILVFLIMYLAIGSSGCAAFIVGSAVGVLGGYAISRDTIQGEVEKKQESLSESALKVLDTMSAMEIDDSQSGLIRAWVGSSRVTITIEQLTLSTSRLKVKCRKNLFPNFSLSEKLYVRIAEQAE